MMGKSMNLNNLSPEEAQQILQVIQKDFELRQKEKERLSKIEEVVQEEDSKTRVLTKQANFNENCCIRCCQTFGYIFNRKTKCQTCGLFVCKSCCLYDDRQKSYNCIACLTESELKQKSCGWFYDHVSSRFKRFGSAKVVRTLYKQADGSRPKFHSDNESDSGYDPSLYSSFGQSGSIRTKTRPSLSSVFPEIHITAENDKELDNGLIPPPLIAPVSPNNNNNSYESSDTSLENIQMSPKTPPIPARRMLTTPTQTGDDLDNTNLDKTDIYKQAFENSKRTEEAKFKVRFDNLVTEMQQSFENISPRDSQVPSGYGTTSYGDLMTTYRQRVKDMLISLSQRLELAVESFDESCANSPSLTSQKVRVIINKLVEDRLGESLDLTSDEAVSDLSSLSDDSCEQKSYEEQIAQAVIARVLELHRNHTGVHLSLGEPMDHRQSESSGSDEKMADKTMDSSVGEDSAVISTVDKGVDTENGAEIDTRDTVDTGVGTEELKSQDGRRHRSKANKSMQQKGNSGNRDRTQSEIDEDEVDEAESDISHENEKIKSQRSGKLEKKKTDKKGVGKKLDKNKNVRTNGEMEDDEVDGVSDSAEDEIDENGVENVDDDIDEDIPKNKSKDKVRHRLASDKSDKGNEPALEPVDDKQLLRTEFEKLRTFAKDFNPRPLYEEMKFDEEIEPEPIEEEIEARNIDHEEYQQEFSSRVFTFDKVTAPDRFMPDFSDLDYEYHDLGIEEIDPDLLSMNLHPILEETEEELEEDKEDVTEYEQDWRGNWIFQGAGGVNPYSSLTKTKRTGGEFSDVNIMVPQPKEDWVPQVGNNNIDDVSDMSENEDRDSLDGLSDEENTFYAKTSEEIARITRKSSGSDRTSALANTSMQTEGESDAESIVSRPYSSSFSDSGMRNNNLEQSSFESRVSEKSQAKLLEDLVPSETGDPKFEIPPISATVPEGEPAKFTCRVAGTQQFDVFWYRVKEEVEELENSENYEIVKDGNRHHLTMYNMTSEGAGQYMCMVMNEKGRCCQYFILATKKNTQELKAPEFLKTPSDVEVTEGQSVKFRCKVKGYPQPRVIWYKDGQILLNELNYKFERFGNRDYILAIETATMDEDAEYSVLARNIAGELRSSAQLIVEPKTKPESVSRPKTKTPSKTNEDKESKSATPGLPDISYLRKGRSSGNSSQTKSRSPSEKKEEQNLTNLSKKMTMTKDSVTEVAEDMLSSSKELTEIDKGIAAMDKILQDLETDMCSVTSEDLDASNDLDPSNDLSCLATLDNYVVLQDTAEKVRVVTSSALDYLNKTDSLTKPSDEFATSTPRSSESERTFNPGIDNSHIPCDTEATIETLQTDTLPDTHDTSEDSHKSEVVFSVNPLTVNMESKTNTSQSEKPLSSRSRKGSDKCSEDKTQTDSSAPSRTEEWFEISDIQNTSQTSTDSASSTSTEPIRVNLGPKRENKERYERDFYITNTPQLPRRTPPTSPREEQQTANTPHLLRQTPPTSPREEQQRARTEEKIYLAASNVSVLDNKVQTLQDKMRAVQALQEQDKMNKLEKQVARTAAQVASSESQVKDIEKSVNQLKKGQTAEEVRRATSTKTRQAPTAPKQHAAPPQEKPEPTFLKGSTSEQDLPESRTEYNEEYGAIELPSVLRLKAMFGGGNSDSSVKRVHSITARSVPKGQLEKLKKTASDDPHARVAVKPSSEPVTPGRATSLTTGQQIKQVPNGPKQVFDSSSRTDTQSETILKAHQPPTQSIQISSKAKTKTKQTVQVHLSTDNTKRPINHSQSESSSQNTKPIKSAVTSMPSAIPKTPVQSDISGSRTGNEIDTPEERKSPKIKHGAISAMSKFWEKRLNEGEKEAPAPEILEYD